MLKNSMNEKFTRINENTNLEQTENSEGNENKKGWPLDTNSPRGGQKAFHDHLSATRLSSGKTFDTP